MIHLGVIGYGYWGPNLVRQFMEIPQSTVLYVADRNPARLAPARTRYPSVHASTDCTEMLGDDRVTAVAIATPLSTHFEVARRILEAGRHVLIEKPLTLTVQQGEILADLAASKQVTLMVGHTLLYSGAVRAMREIVARNELGDIYYFDSVRANLGPFRSDANAMWDLSAHDISIMNYVLGLQADCGVGDR